MGMWIELGIFVIVIAFAIHQIHDVRREQRKRQAEKSEQSEAKSGPNSAQN